MLGAKHQEGCEHDVMPVIEENVIFHVNPSRVLGPSLDTSTESLEWSSESIVICINAEDASARIIALFLAYIGVLSMLPAKLGVNEIKFPINDTTVKYCVSPNSSLKTSMTSPGLRNESRLSPLASTKVSPPGAIIALPM